MCRHAPDLRVALFAADVRARIAFYEVLLVCSPDSSSDSHASFELDETTLFIHRTGTGDHESAPNADHVAFALDQDAAVERVRAVGADVVGPGNFYWVVRRTCAMGALPSYSGRALQRES